MAAGHPAMSDPSVAVTAAKPTARCGDEIETLEEAIDFLLRIMAASISYLTRKAPHVQTNPAIPLVLLSATASQTLVDEETMVESADELVQDLMMKAKQVEAYIGDLPEWASRDGQQPAQIAELEALQSEMRHANEEYRAAVREASVLQLQVSELLHQVCNDQQHTRVALAKATGALTP
ncbi:hypothetical protein K437DRAFT_126255 [Tilletiaria anomala UBC 951]|uniref:Mediator of RNA polymerase II transcription subunit 21 n=1 Tax=Tilletiaria anomala (strain ATCC 24038 / CBS 436.72 / UBC 951) TaxID=1037660 RepID=A0A066W1Z2_TILAU|nr:uncharacterized protein K437DRAFT_126255 [Tilletiaria anomala UBC 951]KDN45099.1 hypothetical protein K437DRAFT_126255 [Tilletiaria anomala UBC 951]